MRRSVRYTIADVEEKAIKIQRIVLWYDFYMHKILSLAYVLIIVSFGGIGSQLYLERGPGLATPENLFFAISFIIGLGLVGYLHYQIYRTSPPTSVIFGAFTFISLLNVLLSLSVVLLYLFASNHGDLLTFAAGGLMVVTLIISVILAIALLMKEKV